MANYLPSLEERKQKLIEYCTDCGDGGAGADMDTSDASFDNSTPITPLDKAMKKLKKKKKMQEESPPGFEGTVKAMKKKKDIDNPYALSWWMKNKGYKSHKKKDGSDK